MGVDAARLADELRSEQELALSFEKDRKLLDCQLKDMHGRLDEAETNALKGGKKAMNKMKPGSGNWNQRLMLKIADLLILPRTFANLREELKNWLINFKPKSKLTRSKLKRLKKLPPSIWPSSAKLKDIWLMLKSVLTLMNKPLPKLKLRDVLDPLFQCKEQDFQYSRWLFQQDAEGFADNFLHDDIRLNL